MPALSSARPSADTRASNGVPGTGTGSAPAQRLSRSRWRQPRLVVGLLLVAAAVVLGARVLAALDDSVLVWQVDSSARAGSPTSGLDVSPVAVRFDDAGTQAAYLSADQGLPVDGVVARDLAPGELLAVTDLRDEQDVTVGQLPIDVPTGSMPADLAAGDRVDVWVVPGAAAGAAPSAGGATPVRGVRVLAQVRVAAVTAAGSTVGDTRQLLVDLSDRDAARLDSVLGQLASGAPVAIRVPAQAP